MSEKEVINMIKKYCESKLDPCTEYLEDSEIGLVLGEEFAALDILRIIERFEAALDIHRTI